MSCFTSSCCLSLDVENKKNNIEQEVLFIQNTNKRSNKTDKRKRYFFKLNNIEQEELFIQNTNKRSNKTDERKRYFFKLNEGKRTTKNVINIKAKNSDLTNKEIVK